MQKRIFLAMNNLPPSPPVAEKYKKLLGYCFFQGGIREQGANLQLKQELKTFLETGKNLKEQKTDKKKEK